MKKVITILLFTCVATFGQNDYKCGTDNALFNNPQLQEKLKQIETDYSKKKQNQLNLVTDMTTVYTVPVVFHVYHLGEAVGTGSNVSNAAIQATVNRLNSVFRATGLHSGLTPDIKIQFVLASYDPNCQPTNGISRVDGRGITGYTNGVSIRDYTMQQALENLSNWDIDQYLNIRVCHSITGSGGFAFYLNDIFMPASSVNTSINNPYLDTFWAHEMGHSMYLYHTFYGDGTINGGGTSTISTCPINNDPDTDGDKISDTAPHKNDAGCNHTAINPCTGYTFGDVLKNIMSYSCDEKFTPKQMERMRFALITYRSSLLTSKGITGSISAPIAINSNRCGIGPLVLTASNCFGSYNWFSSSTGGTSLSNSYSFETPILNSTTNYYVSCSNGGCTSTRTLATATINTTTAPTLIADPVTINSGQSSILTASNCMGTVEWNYGLGSGLTKTVSPTITTIYTATCTVNSCISSNSSVTVTVNPICNVIGGTILPVTQTICQDPSVGVSRLLNEPFVLSAYSGQIIRWEYKTPTSGWNDWGQAGIVSPSNCCFGWLSGTWKVRALIGSGVCQSIYSSEASVVVLPLFTATLTGTQTITAGQTTSLSVALTGVAPWSIVINGTTYTSSASSFTISASPNITTTYTLTNVSNSCGAGTVSGSAVVTVNVPNPCPSSASFPIGVQSSGIYQTSSTITSRSSTLAPAYYSAGSSITLLPGFAVQNGTFTAKIKGCPSVASITGLVLFLPFNGNANDASNNNNNGSIYLASLGNDRFGFPNKAYRFNVGNRITVPHSASLNLTNTFSYSVWVNMQSNLGKDGNGQDSNTPQQCIFTKNCDNGQLRSSLNPQANNTYILQTYANAGDQVTIPFQLNQWKHIATTYDGTTIKQFVDGVLVSTKNIALNLSVSNNYDLIIGNMGCYVYYFNGFLDEFRMYNRGLSNTEILDIYNAEKP